MMPSPTTIITWFLYAIRFVCNPLLNRNSYVSSRDRYVELASCPRKDSKPQFVSTVCDETEEYWSKIPLELKMRASERRDYSMATYPCLV